MENKTNEYYTIDLMHILKTLVQKVWVIILAGLLAAGIGFSVSAFVITPTYSSSIMLYVNNSSFSLGNTNFSISSSEITAAQNLVKTYSVILNNRTTLERVIEKTNVPYTYKELSKMIEAAPANDTEIMKVTVTTEDPYEAAMIANCIAEILPVRVSEIVDGASMEVVDSAIPELQKVSPSITKYTAIGLILGVLLAVAAVTVAALLDGTIHDEDYILQNYDCPILAKVPNLLQSGSKSYAYYYQDKHAADSKSKSKDKKDKK
jgi:capsular polysaccharide biosynthesis protein